MFGYAQKKSGCPVLVGPLESDNLWAQMRTEALLYISHTEVLLVFVH